MKCKFCQNPATVHLTDIINKKKRELHLCEACAKEHNLIPDAPEELDIPALLQFLMTQSKDEKIKEDPNAEICPHCGIKYAQFRAQGRLGCPADYEVFRASLEPLLERIHRSARHAGKSPARFQIQRRETDLEELQQQLAEAVRDERYEEAAQLRDRIRTWGAAK